MKLARIVGSIVAVLAVGYVIMRSMFPLINDVETGKTPAYPQLQVQSFTSEYGKVFAAVVASVKTVAEVTAADEATGEVRAVATTHTAEFDLAETMPLSAVWGAGATWSDLEPFLGEGYAPTP